MPTNDGPTASEAQAAIIAHVLDALANAPPGTDMAALREWASAVLATDPAALAAEVARRMAAEG